MPGFTAEECPWIYGDSLDRIVQWKKGDDLTTDLSQLAGQAVRLVFELRDADLFAHVGRQQGRKALPEQRKRLVWSNQSAR